MAKIKIEDLSVEIKMDKKELEKVVGGYKKINEKLPLNPRQDPLDYEAWWNLMFVP